MSGSDILGLDASLSDTTEHVLVASGPVGLTATEPDGGPDADETRSELRPTAPLGTPTYEGVSSDDTAKLPRIGHAIQAERIWTTRPDPETTETEKAKNGKNGKNGKHGKKIDVTSLTDVGIKLLPEIEPGAPDGPVTNARWAALVRAISRRLTWTLPAAGVIAAAASIGAMVRGGPAHYLTGAEPFRLFAWVTSVWLGVVAMTCLVGLLAAVRSRGSAFTGLMLGIFGGISMLMFAAVPPATPLWGLSAKTLALTCGGVYSAGWMTMGWAVFRSRMFSRGDGLMLVLCGPMVGFAGLWMSPFHTAGALLMIAAGLGIASKSNSTLRAVRAGRAEDANGTGDDKDDDTGDADHVHLDDLVTRRRRERDRDAKDRDAHDQDAKNRDAKNRDAHNRDAHDREARDDDARERGARDRHARDRHAAERDRDDRHADDADSRDGDHAAAKAGRPRRLGWGRKPAPVEQSDQPKANPAKAKPAKQEKPPAAPRRPGKRRLRIGALTKETPSAPTSDKKSKR